MTMTAQPKRSGKRPPPAIKPEPLHDVTQGNRERLGKLATEIATGTEANKLTQQELGVTMNACRAVFKLRGESGLNQLKAGGITGRALLAALDEHELDINKLLAAVAPTLFDGVNAVSVDAEAKKLMEECGAVKLTWSWFRTGIKVDKTAKAAMATAAGTTDSGFSANKRLMGSSHPTIKEANELRGRITGYVKGISLPVTKLGEAGGKKKEGGVVLIRKRDLADFEDRMTAFLSELKTMEEKVNADMPSIKHADQQRLGNLYRESDYPPGVQLRMGYYAVNLDPPAYLEKFAPKMFERERQKAESWWQGVYENAAAEFMEEFRAVIGTWVDALGPVVKIYPDEENPLARFNGAEIRQRITHKENPDVPEGKMMLVVRYKKAGDKNITEEDVGPLTNAEYADLKPNEQADKCRTFKNSTVDNLLAMVTKFRTLGATISASKDFSSLVDEIEAQVKKGGSKPADIGEELRVSKSFRGTIHSLMQQASDKLTGEIQTFTKRRRKVDVTLLADEEE